MILEYCQLLSTAHHVSGTRLAASGRIYKQTHTNHPSAIWVRESRANYKWLHSLTTALCKEYTYRYGKRHKSEHSGLLRLLSNVPIALPDIDQTPLLLAMPDEFKTKSAVKSYRNYYAASKSHLLVWRERPMPNFLKHYGYKQIVEVKTVNM
jgi:hypothetical protein